MLNALFIFGTRPEAIKIAPLIQTMAKADNVFGEGEAAQKIIAALLNFQS